MPVTLKDIANQIGKSVTTVSRALHDYPDVSPETKALVRQTAEEMGYTPNIMAQRLQSKRSEIIGFVIPTYGPRFADPFFSEFLAGIGNRAAKLGYDILVSTRAPGEEELSAYRRKVNSYSVDGFILVRTRKQDPRIEYLCEQDFPFVSFGRVEGNCSFPFVDVDNEFGMRQLAAHLIELGHTRIAYIAAPDDLMFAQFRKAGFINRLKEKGIDPDPNLIVEGDLTQQGGLIAATQLLELDDPPTAIAASNDLMAFGAISAALKKGLRVGEDIAITGFDNVPQAEHYHPSLTTLHQPIYQIGAELCEMLIKGLRGDTLDYSSKLLKPTLMVRESCGGGLVS